MKPAWWIGILGLAGALTGLLVERFAGWLGAGLGAVLGILVGVIVYAWRSKKIS